MAEPEFVTLQVEDGVGTIRLDRPKMNAIDEQLHWEVRTAAQEAGSRADVRAVVIYGGERVFAAGADIKAMSQLRLVDGGVGPGADQLLPRGRPGAQAGHRRDHRLRPGRGLRAGAVRGLPGDGGVGQGRPARDPARRHPRRRRHPAAGPPGRPGQGQGPGVHRPARRGGGGPGAGAGGRRRPRRPGLRRQRRDGRKFAAGPPLALAAAKRAIDEGLDGAIDHGLALESELFAGLFDTEDQKTGMASFLSDGPGKATFSGR